MRYGAIIANPVRDVDRVEGKPEKEPRALTPQERTEWLAQLEADPTAVRKDLPDLGRFMTATGIRIGETLAVEWHQVDFQAATILDEAGLTAREVADQLGHARPSMTQDVYLGRNAINPRAAAALEDIFDAEVEE